MVIGTVSENYMSLRLGGTCLKSYILGRLKQDDCLSPGVQGQPEQHKERKGGRTGGEGRRRGSYIA